MNYELHPLCTLFPRVTGAEFTALCDDIRANGLRHPIVLHDGMILDGGNRYRACLEVAVEPKFIQHAGGGIVSFVLSANLHRRHLSAGQQAAIVASAQDWAQAQGRGGVGVNQHTSKAATLPVSSKDTVADRAAQSGASERTQRMADQVAKADPALARQVAHGEVSLPAAAKQVAKAKPARFVGKPQTGPKAEAIREEIKAAKERGVSMLCSYARLLLGAIRASEGLTEEERDLLIEIATAIQATKESVLQ